MASSSAAPQVVAVFMAVAIAGLFLHEYSAQIGSPEVLAVLLQLGFVYLPFMNTVFGSAPLRLVSWLEAIGLALLILPLIGLEKWWRKRRSERPGAHSDR